MSTSLFKTKQRVKRIISKPIAFGQWLFIYLLKWKIRSIEMGNNPPKARTKSKPKAKAVFQVCGGPKAICYEKNTANRHMSAQVSHYHTSNKPTSRTITMRYKSTSIESSLLSWPRKYRLMLFFILHAFSVKYDL